MNPVRNIPFYFSKIHSNTTSHIRLSIPSVVFLQEFPEHIPLLSHLCYIPCPCHSNYNWRKAQIMRNLIMQFSPTPSYPIPFGFKYSPHTLLSHTRSPYSLLRAQDKTAGKIILLHILIFPRF
jgi:hypothetical protein